MAKHQKEGPIDSIQREEEEEELDLGSDEHEAPLPLTVTSRVLYMLGDIAAGPAYRFTQWLEVVRKRNGRQRNRSSGYSHRSLGADTIMSLSARDLISDLKESPPSEQVTEISVWNRLGKAAMLDIESNNFSWDLLSSLHHTEHSGSEISDDEMNKALEVTVNSGGVVFFALFNQPMLGENLPNEAAAVIKIASSRMATQSERLGYEFAKWLGVRSPQARVVHNCSPEWLQIKEAAEKARDAASSAGDEVGEMTSSELLEALELSRCLFLMNYVHGSPLLESSSAFGSREAAERTAEALGRILMLDLVIRNEDRLPCRQLRWRGNPANLLIADKMSSININALEEAFDSAIKKYRPRVIRALQMERRATSVDSRYIPPNKYVSQSSDISNATKSPKSSMKGPNNRPSEEPPMFDFHIVAIDSGVPRRPPVAKRTSDQANYPKLVELLINSSKYSSNLLYELTAGKLGVPSEDSDVTTVSCSFNMTSVVHKFRNGFRAALRDLQGFQIFLITLHQKLDNLLRIFLNMISRTSFGEYEKEDTVVLETPSQVAGTSCNFLSTPSKEKGVSDSHAELNDSELPRSTPRPSSSGHKEGSDSSSPISRDGSHGKFCKGSGEALNSLRMTSKLRDFYKFAKVDVELNKELEQWNEMLKNDAVKLCHDNNFTTGFFESNDSYSVVDAFELKVRLEHVLERISLISDAANTEKPSLISESLFIGGALAARYIYTLQHLGITHILCLCSNEIGQSDSQYHNLFEYRNFSISDEEDSDIGISSKKHMILLTM